MMKAKQAGLRKSYQRQFRNIAIIAILIVVLSIISASSGEMAVRDIFQQNPVVKKAVRFPIELQIASAEKGKGKGLIPQEEKERILRAINADEVHQEGWKGRGIIVAIIDFGFDLNNPLIKGHTIGTKSFRMDGRIDGAGDSLHGTLIAEIIATVAPESRLYLISIDKVSIGKSDSYQEALNWLANNAASEDIDIVSISVGPILPDDFYDGTGPLAQLADAIVDQGIIVVVAAGNEALSHHEGHFTDSNNDRFHNFKGFDQSLEINVLEGDEVIVVLSWDDWKRNKKIDLWIGVLDEKGNLIEESDYPQSQGTDPIEVVQFKAHYSGTYQIQVRDNLGNAGDIPFEIYLYSSGPVSLEYPVPTSSLSPGIANAQRTITAGALEAAAEIAPYSSRGWANHSEHKVDLVAPGSMTICLGGKLIRRCAVVKGTSFATPIVAGAAALLLSRNPIPDEVIKDILMETAKDLGTEGHDPVYGAGLVDVAKALEQKAVVNEKD